MSLHTYLYRSIQTRSQGTTTMTCNDDDDDDDDDDDVVVVVVVVVVYGVLIMYLRFSVDYLVVAEFEELLTCVAAG